MNTKKDKTTLMLCPICNQGYLTHRIEKTNVMYESVSEDLDLEYYLCSFCGDFADAELSKRNKQRILDFKDRVNSK